MQRFRKSILAVGLVISIFSLAPGLGSAQAQSAVLARLRVLGIPGSAQAQSIIVCDVEIADPHPSGHVPGTVDVVATVGCSAPMSAIGMTVRLFYNTIQRGINSCGNSGKPGLTCVAATAPCLPGAYQGKATAILSFPPGYEPSPQTAKVQTPLVGVACG